MLPDTAFNGFEALGASVEFISEALGHSNLKTTQNYLASFEDDKKKEVARALTAFKNVG